MLSAEKVSHTSIQYMHFVEILNVSLDLSTIYFLILVGVEFPLCTILIVLTVSQNATTCLLESN